jgi:polyferredoxin
MSFREKSAWACLVTTIIVFIPYFVWIFRLVGRTGLTAGSVITAFFIASFWQVLLNPVTQIIIVTRYRREPRDERDVAIESKSFRHAYWVFALLIWPVIMLAALFPPSSPFLMPAFVGQMIFLCFVLAEVTKYLTQVVHYRRGS